MYNLKVGSVRTGGDSGEEQTRDETNETDERDERDERDEDRKGGRGQRVTRGSLSHLISSSLLCFPRLIASCSASPSSHSYVYLERELSREFK